MNSDNGHSAAMSTDSQLALKTDAQRYEALFRISEALSACRDPEELSQVLADQLREFVSFDYLDVLVFRENSNEVEWRVTPEFQIVCPNLPIEETLSWHVYRTQEALHVEDWSEDTNFSRLKRLAESSGVELGSAICLPLTTAHRRLGTLGICSHARNAYSKEDVSFLHLLGRGIALAIDDVLNLRKSHAAQLELERQNARLTLLLDLTKRITSNLDLSEVLRAISASVRQVMHCDAVGVILPDPKSGLFRVYALDFPESEGFAQEKSLVSLSRGPIAKAFETLKPVVLNHVEASDMDPEEYARIAGEGLKSLCNIPLVNRGRAFGILGLGRRTENAFREGDAEFLTQVGGQIAIAIENALAYREISELKDKLAQEKLYLEEEIRSEMNFEHIIGTSAPLKHVLELIETVASSDSTVLLLGDTGTGKELIARAIHDHSRRKQRTFVKLNCAAIPTGLLESELFGHEKGAFTGAISQKIGRLELADQGTLFLDEVGDIPLEIQPKLLRALQEREFERLGNSHTRKVNVRLIAATNRNLEKMISDREFRSDLYYRLNVFPIRIPPLRDRKEDIPLLVRYFVQKAARQMQKQIDTIPAAAMKTLTNWEWPGNIRELENFIERAVILTRGKTLDVPVAELNKPTVAPSISNDGSRGQDVARVIQETISALTKGAVKNAGDEYDEKHRQEIMRILQETKGRVGGADGAAARIGINRTTLLSRMKKFGIQAKQFF
ncbi:MAG: Sigma-54 dependent transcriptional regulator (Modular protein) [Candidatus Angelobacter sp.]|nr:Sigma-54 dependent transcriptional regulator (Modular protein) [Candidatus Angelobacter sp.]